MLIWSTNSYPYVVQCNEQIIGSRYGVDMIHLNKTSMDVVGAVPLEITITVIRINVIFLNKTRMKRVRTVSPRNRRPEIKSRYFPKLEVDPDQEVGTCQMVE